MKSTHEKQGPRHFLPSFLSSFTHMLWGEKINKHLAAISFSHFLNLNDISTAFHHPPLIYSLIQFQKHAHTSFPHLSRENSSDTSGVRSRSLLQSLCAAPVSHVDKISELEIPDWGLLIQCRQISEECLLEVITICLFYTIWKNSSWIPHKVVPLSSEA